MAVVKGKDGLEGEWTYHDSHLTNITDKNFLSAARCIMYARPTRLAESGETFDFQKIGVVQGYNWNENKNIEIVFELGSDIPYLIPGRTTGQIGISRILVAGADLVNVLYSNVDNVGDSKRTNAGWYRSLRDVTTPLDILIAFYDQTSDAVYTRIFTNTWLNSRSESIQAGGIVVQEQVSIIYQAVTQHSSTAGASMSDPVDGGAY